MPAGPPEPASACGEIDMLDSAGPASTPDAREIKTFMTYNSKFNASSSPAGQPRLSAETRDIPRVSGSGWPEFRAAGELFPVAGPVVAKAQATTRRRPRGRLRSTSLRVTLGSGVSGGSAIRPLRASWVTWSISSSGVKSALGLVPEHDAVHHAEHAVGGDRVESRAEHPVLASRARRRCCRARSRKNARLRSMNLRPVGDVEPLFLVDQDVHGARLVDHQADITGQQAGQTRRSGFFSSAAISMTSSSSRFKTKFMIA